MYRKYIVVLLCALILSGCVEDVATIPAPPPIMMEYTDSADDPSPTRTGLLTLSMRMPETFNPLLNEDVTVGRILGLIFENLVVFDETQRPVPNLAESIIFAPDGLSALITLRQDIVWGDGTALTAADLAFSLDVIADANDYTLFRDAHTNIVSHEIIDTHTLRIQYARADSAHLSRLAFPIIPRHHYAQRLSAGVEMMPMGNGKYRLDAYTLMREAVLHANPHFFRGAPYIQEIRVLVIPDNETAHHAFSEGVISALNSTVTEWSRYRGARDVSIFEYVSHYYEFIGFNLQKPAFQDIRVRQAVAHSVDMAAILSNVYLNSADRATTPIHPKSWLFDQDTIVYDFNPDEAARLLDEAAFWQAQDEPFSLLVNAENTQRIAIADMLAEELSRIGMVVHVDRQPFEVYEEMLATQNFDFFIGGFNMRPVPDLVFAFHSDSTPSSGGQNVFGYRSFVMDALLTQASYAVSETAHRNVLNEAQRLLAEDLPVISLVFRRNALLMDRRIHGEARLAENDPFAHIHTWFITE